MEGGRAARAACLAGPIAVFLAWLVIAVSVSVNPWFSIWRNAFSDLGGPQARYPWVYNYGLVAVASLVITYGACMVDAGLNKFHYVGGSFFMVAGLFLAMVGIYHEGTYPHVFVSQWFFYQADLSVLAWGVGSLRAGHRSAGYVEVAIALGGPLGAAMIRWPSDATLEAYGIALIDVFAILAYYELTRVTRHSTPLTVGTSR